MAAVVLLASTVNSKFSFSIAVSNRHFDFSIASVVNRGFLLGDEGAGKSNGAEGREQGEK
ncbi:hypothetical protein H6G35_13030 [Aulosira sp. FACHB-113]|nr:hypothetical protein [Aulosira sp. FACHB-113]